MSTGTLTFDASTKSTYVTFNSAKMQSASVMISLPLQHGRAVIISTFPEIYVQPAHAAKYE